VNKFSANGGTTTLTLSQWRSKTGQDKHSIIATPSQLFVDPTHNNYQLPATSPAVNAGTSTDAPSTDILGNPRPSGSAYDIGCYEYQFPAIAKAAQVSAPAGAPAVAVLGTTLDLVDMPSLPAGWSAKRAHGLF
jgi:hypothetical protein